MNYDYYDNAKKTKPPEARYKEIEVAFFKDNPEYEGYRPYLERLSHSLKNPHFYNVPAMMLAIAFYVIDLKDPNFKTTPSGIKPEVIKEYTDTTHYIPRITEGAKQSTTDGMLNPIDFFRYLWIVHSGLTSN